jgi:hypothetical protein
MGIKAMKAALLSILFAAAMVTTASAAKHMHHHVAHVAHAGTASTSDWPGNPYMDLKQSQVQRFWRDAFDPFDAK